MIRVYLIIGAIISIGLIYWGWHHHVYHQGYEARVAEEQAILKAAQSTIQEKETEYETTIEAASHAPQTSCSSTVDPAISVVLDRLH